MTRLRIVTFALVATLAVGCFAAPVPEPDPNQPAIIEIIAPAEIAQVNYFISITRHANNVNKL